MNSIVTQRFVQCHDKLKADKHIPSSRQFALSLDYLPQSLSEILKGRRDVTIEVLRKAVERYRLNPVFLFTGEGPMFMKDDDQDFRVLTILTDPANREHIVHVPVPAQAGYAGDLADPAFIQSLPAYTLPDARFQVGTHRSFDVVGDSMEPTLFEGDKVICSFLEPEQWAVALKDQEVYVFVTRTDVLVKRAMNLLAQREQVELLSDNDFYKPFRLPQGEIREIWRVRAKICPFLPAPRQSRPDLTEEVDRLRMALRRQEELLGQLSRQLQELPIQKTDSP